jgi:hypothetical protein
MGAQFFDILPSKEAKSQAVTAVIELLKSVIEREEDGKTSMWLGYVRLRGVAKKK